MTDWIEWSGGECPVPTDTEVEARLRKGTRYITCYPSLDLWWGHSNSPYDIVAYRVVSEEPKAETGGWIEWSGGECPVPPDTEVEVRRQSGRTDIRRARKFWWPGPDIVAYRVVPHNPVPENDGWIEWNGGGRPVPPDAMVEVRFAGLGGENVGRADQFQWWGGGNYDDIVAYRVIGQEPKPDLVNSPSHYTDGGIEAIDYIRAKLGPDGFRSYCLGNVLKYVSRAGKKGDAGEDLRKAKVYLEWAIND